MPGVGIQGPEQASQLIGRQSHISLTPYRELFDRVSSGEWVGAAPEDGGSKWLVKGRFVQGVTWPPPLGLLRRQTRRSRCRSVLPAPYLDDHEQAAPATAPPSSTPPPHNNAVPSHPQNGTTGAPSTAAVQRLGRISFGGARIHADAPGPPNVRLRSRACWRMPCYNVQRRWRSWQPWRKNWKGVCRGWA